MSRTQGSELCSQPWAILRNSVGVEDGSYETARDGQFVGADKLDMRKAIQTCDLCVNEIRLSATPKELSLIAQGCRILRLPWVC